MALARATAGTTGDPVVIADAGAILEALADAAEGGEVPSVGLARRDRGRHRPRSRRLGCAHPRRVPAVAPFRQIRVRDVRRASIAWACSRDSSRRGRACDAVPQRDPYHRSTVDAHLVAAAARMAELLAGSGDAGDPIELAAVAQVERPDALLLGALLHDVGNIGTGGHVPIGTAIARDTLDAMGVAGPERDLAVFLVEEHLLLPDTATRRDLSDEDLLLDVAARVGTPERLGALYLLAKADAFATGPAAWTPWRETLVRELVAKVQRVFDRGEMGRSSPPAPRSGPNGCGSSWMASPKSRSTGSSCGCRGATSSPWTRCALPSISDRDASRWAATRSGRCPRKRSRAGTLRGRGGRVGPAGLLS